MRKKSAFGLQCIEEFMQPESTPQPTIEVPTPTHHRQQKAKDDIKNVIYTVLLFILAPLFALFMIMFVFQSYVVDGSSMMPTLQNGNRVFILKLPKTVANLQGQDFIPTRHEIIVFKKPSEPDTQLIKRVIGLPGDRVVVQNSHITIYNADHPGGFNPDDNTTYGPTLEPTTGNVDIIVGDNELFVCGDNRSPGGSLDSRSGLGLVPVQNIVGRLWIRYFPFDEFKVFAHVTSTPRVILSAAAAFKS
jgi:signal peptidase I